MQNTTSADKHCTLALDIFSNLTEVSIIRVTELSPSTKAQVKGKLVGSPQLAGVVDGCKGVVHVVEGDEGIVVAVESGHGSVYKHTLQVFKRSHSITEMCKLTLFL